MSTGRSILGPARAPAAFLPPLAYMALIFWLSGRPAPNALQDMPILLGIKAVHIGEYGLLGLLWIRALSRGTRLDPRWVYGLTVAIAILWGASDEIHQSFVPDRTARAADVVADGIAAILAVAFHALLRRWRATRVA